MHWVGIKKAHPNKEVHIFAGPLPPILQPPTPSLSCSLPPVPVTKCSLCSFLALLLLALILLAPMLMALPPVVFEATQNFTSFIYDVKILLLNEYFRLIITP